VATKPKTSSPGGSLLELVLIVAVALGLALGIQAFLVKPYRIPSGSMLPTLQEQQRVLVNRIGARFSDPSVGDVVVFHPPVGADAAQCGAPRHKDPATGEIDQVCTKATPKKEDTNFIKRVVAGPGDTIAVRGGNVVLNGKRQKEDFIRPCGGGDVCDLPREFRVPADHYFMMGDNRGESDDSRYWGPVPRDWIIGEAFATYWPPKRIGLL
jgi:signal peptidase I